MTLPSPKLPPPRFPAPRISVNTGDIAKDIDKTVAKAADDTEKAASKAVKDTGKTVEKGVADAYNEVTRERESGGTTKVDFTDNTPGPVVGTHYKLEVENGTMVAVFLRAVILTVVESKDGKVVGLTPISGKPGDRIVLNSNQGIRPSGERPPARATPGSRWRRRESNPELNLRGGYARDTADAASDASERCQRPSRAQLLSYTRVPSRGTPCPGVGAHGGHTAANEPSRRL
ncbi:hypothetical protein [Sorangium sp. So ce1097]|uniref:hypothetical protein n=1 Tax=Sorangium sp. So ce1097 TaxID=3133330 RepID=UPI003F5DCB12